MDNQKPKPLHEDQLEEFIVCRTRIAIFKHDSERITKLLEEDQLLPLSNYLKSELTIINRMLAQEEGKWEILTGKKIVYGHLNKA